MGIGSILSALIEKKGLNVNKVAQEASISPQTLYSMIRRDSMKVDIEVLIRVCRVLDIPVEYVYNKYKGEEDVEQPLFSPQEIDLIMSYRELDSLDREILDRYIRMTPTQRQFIKDWIHGIADTMSTPAVESSAPPSESAAKTQRTMTDDELEAEVEAYRAELLAEKEAASASSFTAAAKMA